MRQILDRFDPLSQIRQMKKLPIAVCQPNSHPRPLESYLRHALMTLE